MTDDLTIHEQATCWRLLQAAALIAMVKLDIQPKVTPIDPTEIFTASEISEQLRAFEADVRRRRS